MIALGKALPFVTTPYRLPRFPKKRDIRAEASIWNSIWGRKAGFKPVRQSFPRQTWGYGRRGNRYHNRSDGGEREHSLQGHDQRTLMPDLLQWSAVDRLYMSILRSPNEKLSKTEGSTDRRRQPSTHIWIPASLLPRGGHLRVKHNPPAEETHQQQESEDSAPRHLPNPPLESNPAEQELVEDNESPEETSHSALASDSDHSRDSQEEHEAEPPTLTTTPLQKGKPSHLRLRHRSHPHLASSSILVLKKGRRSDSERLGNI